MIVVFCQFTLAACAQNRAAALAMQQPMKQSALPIPFQVRRQTLAQMSGQRQAQQDHRNDHRLAYTSPEEVMGNAGHRAIDQAAGTQGEENAEQGLYDLGKGQQQKGRDTITKLFQQPKVRILHVITLRSQLIALRQSRRRGLE